MGEYFTTARVNFKGSVSEEKQFKHLIALMNKDKNLDVDNFNELPIELEDVVQHALFGKLEDRGEKGNYYCRYFPDFDLTLAPKLFASLFPNASFSLEIRWEYSVGGGETVFFADYDNNELLIRQCQTVEDVDKLDEDLQNKYEDGELDLEELEQELLAVNGTVKINAERDSTYEKSFFDGDDLLASL